MSGTGIPYTFEAKAWLYSGKGAWHFVSFPIDLATEIRSQLKLQEEGWGRMKAQVRIGNTAWLTAIWFDTKMNTYLLPLKAEIRNKEKIQIGKSIKVQVWI